MTAAGVVGATAEEVVPAAGAPHYEFDEDFQRKIAALLIRDEQFGRLTEGLIKPEFFEHMGLASLVMVVQDYLQRYRKAPGDKSTLALLMKEAMRAKLLPPDLLREAVSVIPELYRTDISDREFVADQVATFARHQEVTRAILESVGMIEKRDFDGVATMLRKALDTGISKTGGAYDYGDQLEARTQRRREAVAGVLPPTGITTGYKLLDQRLYHKGWGRREMALLMGAAKSGKSMAMIGFAVNAIAAGYKTLYVTLEVAASIIAERIDANVSEQAMSELGVKINEVHTKVKDFMGKAAPLIIEEFPTGTMKVSDLRRMIEHYKSIGMVFDLVVLDYADLMAPEKYTDSGVENSKSIYTGLRGLAMSEGFALLTATQTNRAGAAKATATATDVAEDFNRIRIADVVISINVTEEERRANVARLHFAASRNQRTGITIRIEQDIDRAKFITKVLGEEL